MGYHGIPSQGCAPCRKRRVKCDENRPICQKCAKGGRDCFGWRERWDTVFRDEGLKMSQKAKSSDKTSTQSSEPESSESSDASNAELVLALLPADQQILSISDLVFSASLQSGLSPPIEDQALGFFTWSYSSQPASRQTPNIPGYLSCFEALFPAAESGSLLQVAGQAVSLAALGEHLRDNDIIRKSREGYVSAMKLVRKHINDTESPTNQSILSILLLGLYEQISCPARSLRGWAAHIRGALELAKMQPRAGEEDIITRRLQIAVQNQSMIGLVQSERLRGHPLMTANIGQLKHDLQIRPLIAFFSKILALRDEILPLTQDGCATVPFETWNAFMGRASTLLAEIEGWPDRIGRNFDCQSFQVTVPASAKPPISLLVGQKTWTTYSAVWASTIWNSYRIAHSVAAVTCLELHSLSEVWYDEASSFDTVFYATRIHKLTDEVLSSVPAILFPELLNHLPRSGSSEDVSPTSRLFDVMPSLDWQNLEPPKAGNALALLWPLHFVASEGHPSEDQKQLAAEALKYIGDNVGLKIASILGNFNQEEAAIPMMSYPVS